MPTPTPEPSFVFDKLGKAERYEDGPAEEIVEKLDEISDKLSEIEAQGEE